MEQAVIENDTCKTAGNGDKRHTPQVFRRQMDKERKGKLVADPKKNWDTMVAEIAEAIVGRRTAPEKLRWSSSKANIVPARGALNAAARPALAPLVMRYRSSMRVRPMRRLKPWAATAPI